ncbi:MAG: hypothetical protein ACOYU3_08380 [Bacillota bacterium]
MRVAEQIQEWLGHSDFTTAANIYAHLDYQSKVSSLQAIMDGMEKRIPVKMEAVKQT